MVDPEEGDLSPSQGYQYQADDSSKSQKGASDSILFNSGAGNSIFDSPQRERFAIQQKNLASSRYGLVQRTKESHLMHFSPE